MPKVSVIIPVYNVEQYIGSCVDSILGQTLKDIEVICVDDGSTDGSAAIIARYATEDSRVKVLQSKHAGAYRARETGVNASKGEYVYFMDSDDFLKPSAFEELCALADRERLDQVVFSAEIFCDDDVPDKLRAWAGRMTRYLAVSPACCGKVMGGMELMRELLDRDSFHVTLTLRLLRASVIRGRNYPFPDATTRADNYFTALSLHYSERSMAVPDRYYRRRVRNGSISTEAGASGRHSRNLLAVLLALYRFEPFRTDIVDPSTAIGRFAAKLSVETWKMSKGLDAAERHAIIVGVLESASADESAFLMQAQMTAIGELMRRPRPTLKSRLKRMLKRIFARNRSGRI